MKKAIRIVAVLLLVFALVIPANAAEFTPSIEQKGAPAVSTPDTGKLIQLTPISDSDKASLEIKAALEEAYKSIEEAESLDKIAPQLTETLKVVAPTLTVDDLVVRDLVHVIVDQEETGLIKLTFDLGLEKDATLIVMMYVDGEWTVIDPELITINDDGSVTIVFTGKVGILAFITEKSE